MATLLLVFVIVAGMIFYTISFLINGDKWASFPANKSVFTDGVITSGRVLDRDGVVLADITDGVRTYSDSETIRKATLHAVGDVGGNIGTGALKAFASEIIGYNFISGTYSVKGTGKNLYLTLDAGLNEVAYNALEGRSGTIAVYNYKTGDILCMVSSPSYDPQNPPEISADDTSGVYLNRFLSSVFVPGSIFKLVTMAAAIENIPDLHDRTFVCEGSRNVNGDVVTCTGTHGEITAEQALAVSCNCAFAELALELGADTLAEYSEKLGLTESFEINGISTAAGKFEKAEAGTSNLAWSGIGQYNDMVNPAAYLRLMGAIANEGKAVDLKLISKVTNSLGIKSLGYSHTGDTRLLKKETADELKSMMSYNVTYTYGEDRFPGLQLCAKSGTAEVGGDKSPHAWFVGFITNEENPLAFVVLVENGGGGSKVAGNIANTVLQAAVNS